MHLQEQKDMNPHLNKSILSHVFLYSQIILFTTITHNDIMNKRFSAKDFFQTRQTKTEQSQAKHNKQKAKAKSSKIVKQKAQLVDNRLQIAASSLNIAKIIPAQSKVTSLQMQKLESSQRQIEACIAKLQKSLQNIPQTKKTEERIVTKQLQLETKKSIQKMKTGKCRAKIFKQQLIDHIPLETKTSLHRWRYGEGATSSKLIIGNWNVNGIRSVISKKMLFPYINHNKPDIICITETKADQKNFDSAPISLHGYHSYWNFPKHSSGYSGVAVFSKFLPKSATQDMLEREHSQEGRMLTLQFQAFFLINIYVPTVGKELQRSDYRKRYDTAFRQHVNRIRTANPSKPVLIVGDLNVAHTELDTHPGKQIMLTPSFTTIERQGFQEILNMGYTDVYRALHPGVRAYTWWYVNIGGRDRLDTPGLGRRIDYFLMPTQYMKWVKRCDIFREFLGADHCPIQMEIDLDL